MKSMHNVLEKGFLMKTLGVLIFILSFALFRNSSCMESDNDLHIAELWKRYQTLRAEMPYKTEHMCAGNIRVINWEFAEHVERGNSAMVKCLLELGADCNFQVDMGYLQPYALRPITAAARIGNEEICQLLIAAGADLNAQEDQDISYIDYNSNPLVVKNITHYNALWYAVYNGHINIVKLLFTHGIKHPHNNELRLPRIQEITEHKNYAAMRELLKEHGITIKMRSQCAQERIDTLGLIDPINRHRIGWAQRAIIMGANMHFYNITWGSAFKSVARLGNSGKKFARLLLENGANPNTHIDPAHWTPLMEAAGAKDECEDLCRTLLRYGANQLMQNKRGHTALMIAASRSREKTCKLLIDHQKEQQNEQEKLVIALILCLKHHESKSGKQLYDLRKTLLRVNLIPYFILPGLLNLKDNTGKTAYDYWNKEWLRPIYP